MFISGRVLVGTLAAAALLAGCGGSGSQVNPAGAMQNVVVHRNVAGGCSAHGGARVSPCTVDLNASNPGPDTVTTRNPRSKKGTFTESDTCGGASGIATVVLASGDQWTVTAGSTAGSCSAEFDYTAPHGKKVGWAVLNITNEI
ncbi:MAG TPA: hypothetical protein VJP76_03010 [Candidatus Tumulicola sp.]|nr:hypothetical protein [Candidatus Tumulicola sp.]